MHKQTKCFERWVGQIVWRMCIPSIGPLSGKTLGIRRGTINKIYEDAPNYTFKNGCQLHEVSWFADFDWYTGKPIVGDEMKPHQKTSKGVFDCGLITPPEMKILINGGLLSNGFDYFSEPQCVSLKRDLPLYQLALDNPTAFHLKIEN